MGFNTEAAEIAEDAGKKHHDWKCKGESDRIRKQVD